MNTGHLRFVFAALKWSLQVTALACFFIAAQTAYELLSKPQDDVPLRIAFLIVAGGAGALFFWIGGKCRHPFKQKNTAS